jgi:predicted transcriptional regulator
MRDRNNRCLVVQPKHAGVAEDVPAFLQSMHSAVLKLHADSSPQEQDGAAPVQEYVPAVTVRKSLSSRDHLISLIDGKPYKTLKRHLSTHGLTPAEYRERYGLKPDYPMVSVSYAQTRRDLAKKIGLGRKPDQKSGEAAAPVAPPAAAAAGAKQRRAAKPKAAAPAAAPVAEAAGAKPRRAAKPKAAAPTSAPPVASPAAEATGAKPRRAAKSTAAAQPAAAVKPAAERKPARRKKLGVKFDGIAAPTEA